MTSQIVDSLNFVENHREFVELRAEDGYVIDLRYATPNNFTGQNLYGPFNRAFLHSLAAGKLSRALSHVQRSHPDHRFLIFDALRPRCIQRILWSHVVGTPEEMYVANPDRGSLHNFGMAIDLTVIDGSGRELDMGAGFDDFREIAQPEQEARFLAEGKLTSVHIKNRLLLREAMESAGFRPIRHEWWHFDALPRQEARDKYTIVE